MNLMVKSMNFLWVKVSVILINDLNILPNNIFKELCMDCCARLFYMR